MNAAHEPFLSHKEATQLADTYGTPLYVYDEQLLLQAAEEICCFPNAFGLVPRYAMKANSNAAILRILHRAGIQIDASSGFEAQRAMRAGIPAKHISLTSQALAVDLAELITAGVHFTATSLDQIDAFGRVARGGTLGLRINPGLGSGGTKRTNVGGPASSFGIWHEHIEDAKERVAQYGLTVSTIHTHIGSGSDPAVWQRVAQLSVPLLEHFPSATAFNLGGGYKVGRMPGEQSTNIQTIAKPVVDAFKAFHQRTGRKITLEVEPGTYLVALSGGLLARIASCTSTGADGYFFYKLDTGMSEILRPSLYGAQHPLWVLQEHTGDPQNVQALVVGHCCESGDILTPAENDPEGLLPRTLPKAEAGALVFIGGTGAYCSAMAAKNYNSFPEAAEVLRRVDGSFVQIRKRQTLEQLIANELPLKD